MIAQITYFDLKGYKIKTTSVDQAYCAKFTEIIFPGDLITAVLKMKEMNCMPAIVGNKYHVLIEVTAEKIQMTKLVPYDYLEEIEKIRTMSSKDIEAFTK